jgi:hypothetical protein
MSADTTYLGIGSTADYLRKLATMLDEGRFEVTSAQLHSESQSFALGDVIVYVSLVLRPKGAT